MLQKHSEIENFDDDECSTFIRKTYQILEIDELQDNLCWGTEGRSFIIKNVHQFSETVLPKFFKHTNFNSFVRQLNFYGFRKIKNENQYSEFQHRYFQAGRRDLLCQIKRKTCHQKKPFHVIPEKIISNLNSEEEFPNKLSQYRKKNNEMENCCKTLIKQNQVILEENKILFKNLMLSNYFRKFKFQKLIEKLQSIIVDDTNVESTVSQEVEKMPANSFPQAIFDKFRQVVNNEENLTLGNVAQSQKSKYNNKCYEYQDDHEQFKKNEKQFNQIYKSSNWKQQKQTKNSQDKEYFTERKQGKDVQTIILNGQFNEQDQFMNTPQHLQFQQNQELIFFDSPIEIQPKQS